MMRYKQAKQPYKLNNPNKYIGDPEKLLYKSSWEQEVFRLCDNNPNIIKWGYEIYGIKYLKPVDGGLKMSIYYPDLYVEYFDKDQNFNKEIIEIKPNKQTKPSRAKKTIVKLQENYTYIVNSAKWDAADKWCRQRGIKFSIMTEKSIFNRKNK